MGKAARAIIIEDGRLLLMLRNKAGSQYFTLVGGQVNEGENIETALVREIQEETGLIITAGREVYRELHAAPYNEQYIYLCEVAPHGSVGIQGYAEENLMNKIGFNTHEPIWVPLAGFEKVPFRTPQLQTAIVRGLSHGFPAEPETLT